MISIDDELETEYLAECREHLATIETDLLAFESGETAVSQERTKRVFRAVHSIKGSAGFSWLGDDSQLGTPEWKTSSQWSALVACSSGIRTSE